jgi:hypothetical protein
MKPISVLFLSTFAATFLATAVQCHLSFASRDCTQGPDCDQLNQTIKRVKDAKNKRHQDVRQYGKDSSQVKNDDLVLTQAIQKDHELRSDRKNAEKPSGKHHRSQHHSNHPATSPQAGKHGATPRGNTAQNESSIDLTPL